MKILLTLLALSVSVLSWSQAYIRVTQTSNGGCGGTAATGTLEVVGYEKVLKWQTRDGSEPWYTLSGTSATRTYSVSSNTYFRAEYISGVFTEEVLIVKNNTPATVAGVLSAGNYFCSTASGTLTLTGAVGEITWEKNMGGSWETVTNSASFQINGNVLTYSNLTASFKVRAMVRGGSCALLYSAESSITVHYPDDGDVMGSRSLCEQGGTNLTLTENRNSVVRWEKSPDLSVWSTIANTTTTLNTGFQTSTAYYRAVTWTQGCGEINSNWGYLDIHQKPQAGTVSFSPSSPVCAGDVVEVSVTGNSGTPRFYVSSTNGTTWNVYENATLGNPFFLTLDQSATWVIKTHPFDAVCGVNTASESRVSVRATSLSVPEITGPTVVFSGQPETYTIQAYPQGTQVEWHVDHGNLLAGQGSTTLQGNFLNGHGRVTATVSNDVCIRSSTKLVSTRMNYVREQQITVGGVVNETDVEGLPLSGKLTNTQYMDGLGRLIQTVQRQGSPNEQDVIQPFAYDEFGMQSTEFLPYISEDNGDYKTFAISGSHDQSLFYANGLSDRVSDDQYPILETVFEASPQPRPEKKYGPGVEWRNGTNRYTEFQYLTNRHGASTGEEHVIAWKINPVTHLPERETPGGMVVAGGYFDTGSLYVNVVKDEDGNAVREYIDQEGQVILKKVQAGTGPGNLNSLTDWASTYYIYDDFGNLVMVLPPEATKQLIEMNAQN